MVTAAVEPFPKNNQENLPKKLSLTTTNFLINEEKQALILERPKRISFCKDPVITTLDINSTSSAVNQSTQPTVRYRVLLESFFGGITFFNTLYSALQLQSSTLHRQK